MYCEKCKHIFEGERCPNCRRGRVRQVKPDDPCYLTEKRSPLSGMLGDVLRQEKIPYMTSGRLGAGLSTYVGFVLEITRFVCSMGGYGEGARDREWFIWRTKHSGIKISGGVSNENEQARTDYSH